VYRRLLAPVEALLTTDAVSSLLQDQQRRGQQPEQHQDQGGLQADETNSVDDAASELSDEEAASVIEVEVGPTDRHPVPVQGQITVSIHLHYVKAVYSGLSKATE